MAMGSAVISGADVETFLGPKRQSETVVSFTRNLQELGQHKAHFFNHTWPSVGFNDEARHVVTGCDPDARLGYPTGFDSDGAAHHGNIVYDTTPVDATKLRQAPSCTASAWFSSRTRPGMKKASTRIQTNETTIPTTVTV